MTIFNIFVCTLIGLIRKTLKQKETACTKAQIHGKRSRGIHQIINILNKQTRTINVSKKN